MSVGRITIYNHHQTNLNQGLCWTNGFHLMRQNKIIERQLKELDKKREQQIAYFKKSIIALNKESDNPDDLPKYMEDIYYGSPFSYYNFLRRNN